MRKCVKFSPHSCYCNPRNDRCPQALLSGAENRYELRCPRKPFVGKQANYVKHRDSEGLS